MILIKPTKNEKKSFNELYKIAYGPRKAREEYISRLQHSQSYTTALSNKFSAFILSNYIKLNMHNFFIWVCIYEKFLSMCCYTPSYIFRYFKLGAERVAKTLALVNNFGFMRDGTHVLVCHLESELQETTYDQILDGVRPKDVPWELMKSTMINDLFAGVFPFVKDKDTKDDLIGLFKKGKISLRHFIGSEKINTFTKSDLISIIDHPSFRKNITTNIRLISIHFKDILDATLINKIFNIIIQESNYEKILKNNKKFINIANNSRISTKYKLLIQLL